MRRMRCGITCSTRDMALMPPKPRTAQNAAAHAVTLPIRSRAPVTAPATAAASEASTVAAYGRSGASHDARRK